MYGLSKTRMTQEQLFITMLSVIPLTQPTSRATAIKGDFVTAFNGHRMWPEQHLQQLPEKNTREKKKSSFVTQCFIFQKTSLRCALETLLLGISFFSQAAYLSALVLDMILRAYLPSDQNFFPTCFFIKIIRAWNQLLFFFIAHNLCYFHQEQAAHFHVFFETFCLFIYSSASSKFMFWAQRSKKLQVKGN